MYKLTVKNEKKIHHTATVCALSLDSFVRKHFFSSDATAHSRPGLPHSGAF